MTTLLLRIMSQDRKSKSASLQEELVLVFEQPEKEEHRFVHKVYR